MPQKMYYGGTTFPQAYKKGGKVKAIKDDDDCDYKAKGGKVYAKGGPVGTKTATPAGRVMQKKKGGMC